MRSLFSLFCCVILCAADAGAQVYKKVKPILVTPAVQTDIDRIRAIQPDVFESRSFRGNTAFTIPYRFHRPVIAEDRRYPLVVIFHGSGAIGTDNVSQVGFLAKSWMLPSMQERFPAFVLVPQFPVRSSNYEMDPVRHVLTSKVQAPVYTVLALIDSLLKELPIDSNRIYLQGFSMGASTVMNALTVRPKFFAAGVAFSGIADLDAKDNLQNVPLWIMHGNADTENPFASDSLFSMQMRKRGAKQLHLWEMDGLAHELPFGPISEGKIAAWLFGKRRRQ